jgi:hypothetical protein
MRTTVSRSQGSAFAAPRAAWSFAVVALVGCASAPPPPVVAAAAPVVVPEKVDNLPAMESEIGGLNEEAMDKAFASLGLDVQRCVAGASKLDVLGGDVKVRVRIDRKGSARWAYVSASTLGDRDVEKCILESARAKSWPLPVGGEGLAEKSYAVDPSKAPNDLSDERRVRADVARARAQVQKCRRGLRGQFTATAYLTPEGRVARAGMSLPNEKAEDAADCMVDALRKARFQRPGRDAKLSFSID